LEVSKLREEQALKRKQSEEESRESKKRKKEELQLSEQRKKEETQLKLLAKCNEELKCTICDELFISVSFFLILLVLHT
jgi:hypothetical protein